MATLFIIAITGIVTVIGFSRPSLVGKLLFRPRDILQGKEWHRLMTSALVHADWMHVIFNLIALHSFGRLIEIVYSPQVLLFIYLTSILGGSLLSLVLHRNHEYAALGASGGVCGVMFASIFLIPGTSVAMFFIPIGIPGPIFALLYLVGTFFALRQGGGNIGHDAHFGGAAAGLLLALAVDPRKCMSSPWFFFGALAFAIGCLVFLNLDFLRSLGLGGSRSEPAGGRFRDLDENRVRRESREEVDRILDKISRKGMDSLTAEERRLLDELRGRGM